MTTMVLDPLGPVMVNHRISQNIVLDIYITEWFNLAEENRRYAPYQVVIEDQKTKYMVDKEGKVVCEFGIHNNAINVYWIRSWKDYQTMDLWGQSQKSQRG